MKRWIKYQSVGANNNSIANRLRKKRMGIVKDLMERKFSDILRNGGTIRTLDIGGTYSYWKSMHFEYFDRMDITIVNIIPIDIPDDASNVRSIVGDATNLSEFNDQSFDFVFSNSCIEHVGKMDEWKKMASEMKRLSKVIYLQTPNRYFPIEPHFLFPMYQFLPESIRIAMLRRFVLGHMRKRPDKEQAREAVNSINLLSLKDLNTLFPESKIYRERLWGLTKSFMVIME